MPAVKLKLIELASLTEPGVTVVAVPVELVTLTTGVPVRVNPVIEEVVQTVPVEVTVMLPVPKASDLLLALLLLKVVDVRV